MSFFKTVLAIVVTLILGAAVLVGSMATNTPAGQLRPFTAPPAQESPGQSQGSPPAQESQPSRPQAQVPAAQQPSLQQARESDAVVDVYERVSPAVVNITFTGRTVDPFGRSARQEGTGSGFIIDKEGHIVTNQHVVANASRLDVTLADGNSYVGQLVVTDPATDLAIIKLQAPADKLAQLTTVALGSSEQMKVGQAVVAIGNPFGLERSASLGIV